MTNPQNGRTGTTRRRHLTRVLTAGAFAAAAAVSMAVPAQAAPAGSYHVAGHGARVLTAPGGPAATPVTTLRDGAAITIDCGAYGRGVRGDNVWHHITSPVSGYVADYDTDAPGFARFVPGESTCPSSPVAPAEAAPAAPAATRGATINYNEGYGGSCVYYVENRFHQRTGVYPRAFGDARYLASGAQASGWTVSSTPRVDSIAIFQPGQNGAGAPTGHAAWVEQVSGNRIFISEMNAPRAWVVTHRWLTPAQGVRYIYAP